MITLIIGIIGIWLNIGLTALIIYSSIAWILPAVTKEYADKAHGCIWDWHDILADAIGGILATIAVIIGYLN